MGSLWDRAAHGDRQAEDDLDQFGRANGRVAERRTEADDDEGHHHGD
jgi:hypothetical protein